MNELDRLPIPLLEWYSENARTMPWRSDPTPYHVFLSEIMLQQTRVAAVREYYRRFLEELPTINDLAEVDEERLLKLWQGLGYYNRARNLQKAARQVRDEFGGVFPRTFAEIISLAGVGEYTAGAIGSIAFGLPVTAVDGNVLRVVARLTGDDGDVTRPETKNRMRDALQKVLPKGSAGDFNQAMMELGATVCLPNGAPLCDQCPAKEFCAALAGDCIGALPVKTKKPPRRREERDVYLIFDGPRVALRRRAEKGLLAGLWEYPNELCGAPPPMELEDVEFAATGKHIFTHIEWHLTSYVARAAGALPEGWVWADKAQLRDQYAVPNAFSSVTRPVEERLEN